MLVADTDALSPIFGDDEINAALAMTSSQAIDPAAPLVYSVWLAGATLLESLAGTRARLAVTRLLDVNLDGPAAGRALLEVAKRYRDTEKNGGGFAIAEMVTDTFTFREKVIKEWLRTL